MTILKKFLVYIIAGVIIALAIGFHFMVTRKMASQFGEKVKSLDSLRSKLKGFASKPDTIHNDAEIAAANERSKEMKKQCDDCERNLAFQPRHAQTRRFLEIEDLGTGDEIKENVTWRRVYEERFERLRKQLSDAGFLAFNVQPSTAWGMGVPDDAQITAAMEAYWRYKDMADFLTEQVEKDLAAYMTATTEAGSFPAKPADLAVSRAYNKLDELLRSQEKPVLIETLKAIMFNPKEQDLAVIFDENLPGFPWSEVLKITVDEAQRRYLNDLVPPGKDDIANKQRFVDFIMELRQVRYRSDVTGLLDRDPQFSDEASMLRKGTAEDRARLIEQMGNWSTSKLAQAIATIVCIRNEKDYNLVRNNHSPRVIELATLSMSSGTARPEGMGPGMLGGGGGPMGMGGGPMGGGPMGGGNAAAATTGDLYNTFPFTMRVKVEYERIPVFLRRFLNSSWRYTVKVLKVTPAGEDGGQRGDIRNTVIGGGAGGGFKPGAGIGGGLGGIGGGLGGIGGGLGGIGGGLGGLPYKGAASATTTTTLPGKAGGGPGSLEPVEVKNYVWLDISGEAYQFSPIRAKIDAADAQKAREAAANAAAPAGGGAP